MFLTEQDICDLTDKERHDAQARALRYLGIDFRPRADGSLVVLKSHVEKMLGGMEEKKIRVKTEPNWNHL